MMTVSFRSRATRGLLVALAVVAWAGPARISAATELETQMSKFAKEIKKFLDDRGEKAISIGQFTGPPQLAANPGPGLILMLERELTKEKVAVKRLANLGISGEFRAVTDQESGQLAVELQVKVVDRANKALCIRNCGILGAAEVSYLLALNTQVAANDSASRRAAKITKDFDRPPVFIKDGYLSLKPNRPFGVEILVGGAIRAPVLEDGTPFVDIKRGEIYQVRLINNTATDVAAELTIDGLNVFTFNSDPDADGKVRNDHKVVVPAKESVLVKGWYRTSGKCDSFLVTKYVDSAAALWPASSNIGVITARFHACWPKDGTPPVDEATSSVNATGFGPPIDERYMQVARAFGQMRAALSIRYSK